MVLHGDVHRTPHGLGDVRRTWDEEVVDPVAHVVPTFLAAGTQPGWWPGATRSQREHNGWPARLDPSFWPATAVCDRIASARRVPARRPGGARHRRPDRRHRLSGDALPVLGRCRFGAQSGRRGARPARRARSSRPHAGLSVRPNRTRSTGTDVPRNLAGVGANCWAVPPPGSRDFASGPARWSRR